MEELSFKVQKKLCKLLKKLNIEKTDDKKANIQPIVQPVPESSVRTVRPAHAPLPPPEVLRQELTPELQFLKLVQTDTELAAWLLDTEATEGRQLTRLIAMAAQWDQILQLWDRLAERCKEGQRPASIAEKEILTASLSVHNLIWNDKQAYLKSAILGVTYNYEQHERGTTQGDKVNSEWLPGLVNPAGTMQKKPLVQT